MKKVLLSLGFAALSTFTFGQMGQGSVSIDPYIGIPNWANSIIYNQYDGNATNVQDYQVVGSMLSYGGRVEYMISDQVGIGADVNYEVSGYSFKFDDYVYDANGNALQDVNGDYLITTYQTQYTAKKMRAMFRLNFHFVQSEKVDMYTAFAGGYRNVNRTSETNPTTSGYSDINLNGALIPVAGRLAVGAKIYFTQNIGAHVELGAFGGGLLQAGLSVKF
ncbi:MAG: hypothetical protein RL110_1102 [Bacteroidota bacterium]|jgi:hypothetical protein